ncbi:MAG: nucleotide pyrophosphohydrolase [Candidatus Latescibacterota bacterium]|jgi:NTP pyrophosphatase (non-canonical NTP hydrolase)|nr:MAG: nucleotide pyrophosphohydrolase [Candidatus Latescibacterota bacterium]
MDDRTVIGEMKEKIRLFCEERDWDRYHNAKDLAIGVITEAAELVEHFRFKSEEESEALMRDPEKRSDIAAELADIFYFILRLAQRYDIDLSDTLLAKLQLNAERYPIDKAKGSNKKYSERE